MADSWEDEAVNQPPKLNPAAASFSFNPGASTCTPPGASNTPEEPPKPAVAPPSKPESTPSPKPAAPEPKANGAQESAKDVAPESREECKFSILDHQPSCSPIGIPAVKAIANVFSSPFSPSLPPFFLQPLKLQPSK